MVEEISFSTFDYQEFNPEHAALYQRTWKQYIESGQGKALTARQINAFYHQNPEGKALLSVATIKGKWVGSIAAVPTRCGKSVSDTELFFQIGDFMVDPSVQGQGVGSRILTELTAALTDRSYLTYTFPNARSVGLFIKQGYQKVREIPTRIFLPQLEAIIQRSDSNLTEISLSDAESACDELAQLENRHNLIIKDGEYIKWRYSDIRDTDDYQFFLLRSNDNQLLGLIVTTMYRFSGIRFLVVLDLIVSGDSSLNTVFSNNISLHSPLQLGFSTIDRDFPKARLRAALPVPTQLNPRPIILLTLPKCASSFELASSCRFVTADWQGF